MGFRMRKSFKVAPGMRVNVSRSGLGMSAGAGKARVTAHSSGRRSVMAGNPIFGMGYMEQWNAGSGRRRTAQPGQVRRAAAEVASAPRKPGLFAPRADKALHKALAAKSADDIERVGDDYAGHRALAYALAGFLVTPTDKARAERLLARVIDSGEEPGAHPFLSRYDLVAAVEIPVAPGVRASLTVCREAVGLALAELRQESGDLDGAIGLLRSLPESPWVRVSLAELLREADRHEEVMTLTERVENLDDLSALLLVFRGAAMRELGFHDGALEALREALRLRSRTAPVRNLARFERAETYLAQGKRGMARKDYERLLAEDGAFPGLRERLDELSG